MHKNLIKNSGVIVVINYMVLIIISLSRFDIIKMISAYLLQTQYARCSRAYTNETMRATDCRSLFILEIEPFCIIRHQAVVQSAIHSRLH